MVITLVLIGKASDDGTADTTTRLSQSTSQFLFQRQLTVVLKHQALCLLTKVIVVFTAGLTLTFTDGSKLDLINAGNAAASHDVSVPGSAGEPGITATTNRAQDWS